MNRAVTMQASLAWAALSFIGFVAALFATLPLMAAAQLTVDIPHMAQMAAWSLIWGSLSLAGVVIAARLSFGRWLGIPLLASTSAIVGIVLSAIVHVTLQEWEIERFGIVDPDMVGWTAGLFGVLVGQATALFGSLIAPAGARIWPVGAAVCGSVLGLLIVASNAMGLGDGIEPQSWPLAIWIGASAIYLLASAAVALLTVLPCSAASRARDRLTIR